MAESGASRDAVEQASASIQKLNRDFYRLEPSSYFFFRLRNLLLSAGRGLELEQLMGKGVEVGVFKVAAPEGTTLEALDEEQCEKQQAFVTLETEVLLHHAAETLLRLYLAHETAPSCPWISMSRERSPRKFKRNVRNLLERLETDDGCNQMARIFFGTTDRMTFGETAPSEETWASLINSSREWLTWLGKYILDGDVYNAAKHGLGVYPKRVALTVEIDGSRFLDGSGPCLEFLQSTTDEEGKRQWRRTTKWLHWDRLFASIHIACQLIHRLWTVASVHHGDGGKLDLELRVFASPSELFDNQEMILTTLSHSLGFDADSLA